MARLVVDSDDEFPNVADLLKSSKSMKKTVSTSTKTSKKPTEGAQNSKPTSRGKGKLASEEPVSNDEKREKKDVGVSEKPKPRKRILKPKNNNPLLQPFSASTTTSQASEVTATRKPFTSKKPVAALIKPADSESEPEEPAQISGELSEFIVEDESDVEVPPPRSTRRLVKGRRRRSFGSEAGEAATAVEVPKINQNRNVSLRKPFNPSLNSDSEEVFDFESTPLQTKPLENKGIDRPTENRPVSSDVDLDFGLLKL